MIKMGNKTIYRGFFRAIVVASMIVIGYGARGETHPLRERLAEASVTVDAYLGDLHDEFLDPGATMVLCRRSIREHCEDLLANASCHAAEFQEVMCDTAFLRLYPHVEELVFCLSRGSVREKNQSIICDDEILRSLNDTIFVISEFQSRLQVDIMSDGVMSNVVCKINDIKAPQLILKIDVDEKNGLSNKIVHYFHSLSLTESDILKLLPKLMCELKNYCDVSSITDIYFDKRLIKNMDALYELDQKALSPFRLDLNSTRVIDNKKIVIPFAIVSNL